MTDNQEEKEIDLLDLARKLWDNKKFIIKVTLIGAIIGVIIALSIPKEYRSSVILITSSGKTIEGNMGALASMAGINLGGDMREDIFPPELYPNVLNSTPFIKRLLNTRVVDTRQNIDTTLYCYLDKKQSKAWWAYILDAPKNFLGVLSSTTAEDSIDDSSKNKYFISKDEMLVIKSLTESYGVSTDKKTGITTLEVRSQSPVIAAFLVDTLTSYLQTYIIEQRTKKAKTDLENSEKLHDQAKIDYYNSQQKLASFVDANKNVISAKYKINQEKLQNEASVASILYNQMAQQVQMNRIKVQDNTPVFTIIQPAIEPLKAFKPKRKLIVVFCIIASMIGAVAWVHSKQQLYDLKKKLTSGKKFE